MESKKGRCLSVLMASWTLNPYGCLGLGAAIAIPIDGVQLKVCIVPYMFMCADFRVVLF